MNEISKKMSPAATFRKQTTAIATSLLSDWVGEGRAADSIGRVTSALSAAAATARNPDDFYACCPRSIGRVIATSALTGINVGTGSAALAYAIPRRPRRGEQPQLNYQLSHRGVNALAKRCGITMVATGISYKDELAATESGDILIFNRDIDDPPTTWEELRGVHLCVRSLDTGAAIVNQFVPKKMIDQRREISDAYQFAEKNDYAKKTSPWHKWPVEMAQKTAMHYAVSRGWAVIDDTESVRALSIDAKSDLVIDAPSNRTVNLENQEVGELPEMPGPDWDEYAACLESAENYEAVQQVKSAFSLAFEEDDVDNQQRLSEMAVQRSEEITASSDDEEESEGE